jgi:hypothetical protein
VIIAGLDTITWSDRGSRASTTRVEYITKTHALHEVPPAGELHSTNFRIGRARAVGRAGMCRKLAVELASNPMPTRPRYTRGEGSWLSVLAKLASHQIEQSYNSIPRDTAVSGPTSPSGTNPRLS